MIPFMDGIQLSPGYKDPLQGVVSVLFTIKSPHIKTNHGLTEINCANYPVISEI